MKTLLIDDESLPRRELRRMLRAFPQIEIVGEAPDAVAARESIERLRPELLLLDIQLPEESGLDLLASLREIPQVIIVTAHDEHALRAFEFGATDYVLKPVQEARLQRALERVLQRSAATEAPPGGSTAETEEVDTEHDPAEPMEFDQRVLLRDGTRSVFTPISAIIAIEACGPYARIILPEDRPLIHRSLAFLERRLPEKWFFRANRHTLINLRMIKGVEPWFSGGLRVTLEGGHAIEVSRRQARTFRDRLML